MDNLLYLPLSAEKEAMLPVCIVGVPEFWIALDLATAQLLQRLSIGHYDGTCISAGMVGGFIYGWCNLLSMPPIEPGLEVKATWRQLDICLKICELPSSLILEERDMIHIFVKTARFAMGLAREQRWKIEVVK